MLFDLLKHNNIKLNVQTVFFGGGSPTILNRDDLKFLVDKLKKILIGLMFKILLLKLILEELMQID